MDRERDRKVSARTRAASRRSRSPAQCGLRRQGALFVRGRSRAGAGLRGIPDFDRRVVRRSRPSGGGAALPDGRRGARAGFGFREAQSRGIAAASRPGRGGTTPLRRTTRAGPRRSAVDRVSRDRAAPLRRLALCGIARLRAAGAHLSAAAAGGFCGHRALQRCARARALAASPLGTAARWPNRCAAARKPSEICRPTIR